MEELKAQLELMTSERNWYREQSEEWRDAYFKLLDSLGSLVKRLKSE